MFLKTDINSGINFLAFGPAGFLNDQQYGSVWAFWKCYLSTINTKEPLKTLPNPLGPGPYGKKFTDLRWMNDHSLFTNLMYKLDLGEFPNTTISYLRWKEHSPKTLSSGHSLSTRSLQTPKKKAVVVFEHPGFQCTSWYLWISPIFTFHRFRNSVFCVGCVGFFDAKSSYLEGLLGVHNLQTWDPPVFLHPDPEKKLKL